MSKLTLQITTVRVQITTDYYKDWPVLQRPTEHFVIGGNICGNKFFLMKVPQPAQDVQPPHRCAAAHVPGRLRAAHSRCA